MASNEPVPVALAAAHDTPLGSVWVAMSENGLVFVDFRVTEQQVLHAVQRRGYRVVASTQRD